MIKESLRVVVLFDDEKKLVPYSLNQPFEEFQNYLIKLFKITSGKIKIFESQTKAEIVSTAIIQPQDLLVVETEAVQIQILSQDPHCETNKIDIKELVMKEIPEEELYWEINQWAVAKKFRLISLEGKKPLKDGFKRVMGCPEKGCKFKLTFKSDTKEEIYRLDYKLGERNSVHEGKLIVSST